MIAAVKLIEILKKILKRIFQKILSRSLGIRLFDKLKNQTKDQERLYRSANLIEQAESVSIAIIPIICMAHEMVLSILVIIAFSMKINKTHTHTQTHFDPFNQLKEIH